MAQDLWETHVPWTGQLVAGQGTLGSLIWHYTLMFKQLSRARSEHKSSQNTWVTKAAFKCLNQELNLTFVKYCCLSVCSSGLFLCCFVEKGAGNSSSSFLLIRIQRPFLRFSFTVNSNIYFTTSISPTYATAILFMVGSPQKITVYQSSTHLLEKVL